MGFHLVLTVAGRNAPEVFRYFESTTGCRETEIGRVSYGVQQQGGGAK